MSRPLFYSTGTPWFAQSTAVAGHTEKAGRAGRCRYRRRDRASGGAEFTLTLIFFITGIMLPRNLHASPGNLHASYRFGARCFCDVWLQGSARLTLPLWPSEPEELPWASMGAVTVCPVAVSSTAMPAGGP